MQRRLRVKEWKQPARFDYWTVESSTSFGASF
jgi:hypothetical protein